MTSPSVPSHFQKEGPASPCTLQGVNLEWANCSCLSCAMGIDRSTINHVIISGCQVRSETGDHVGGTTLTQMYAVAANHGVKTELHVGANVASMYYLAYQCALGRGFIVQGNTQPDGRGNVNHAVWVNKCWGGTLGSPAYFDVWDPWSNGPATWTYAKLKAFMLALHPWGEKDPRTLKSQGINGGYALVFPDTEPHVHLSHGGVRTSPFPDKAMVKSPDAGLINVRTGPGTQYPLVSDHPHPKNGDGWTSFQKVTNGSLDHGSRVWYGDHTGTHWTHESNIVGEGGAS